ncbi:MAG: hypothetical protein JSW17_03315, partial [Candidatus Omnitrophota bacterium]
SMFIDGYFILYCPSNQLVAGLALIVGSAYLIKNKKNCLIALVPAIIMFLITISALIIKSLEFFDGGKFLLFSLNIVLALLGIFIVVEFTKKVPNKIIDSKGNRV